MRTVCLALLMGTAGCRDRPKPAGPSAELCEQVRARPGEALTLLQAHAKGAADIWRHIEICFAPDGDACERAWVGLRAAPSMARPSPAEAERQRTHYVTACRTLPEPQQSCLQVSRAIAAPEKCAGAEDALDRALKAASRPPD